MELSVTLRKNVPGHDTACAFLQRSAINLERGILSLGGNSRWPFSRYVKIPADPRTLANAFVAVCTLIQLRVIIDCLAACVQ